VKRDKLINVVDKARQVCKNPVWALIYHFLQAGKMIEWPKGAKRKMGDVHLTRHAGYRIVQIANPSRLVRLGQPSIGEDFINRFPYSLENGFFDGLFCFFCGHRLRLNYSNETNTYRPGVGQVG